MTIAFTDEAGALLPARIELNESSGPVSPRYQYSSRVVITCAAGAPAAELSIEHSSPNGDVKTTAALEPERYIQLWADLSAHDVFSQGAELSADLRQRVGVSFNFVEIAVGSGPEAEKRVRFEYLLNQLRLPAHQEWRAVIEILKAFLPKLAV